MAVRDMGRTHRWPEDILLHDADAYTPDGVALLAMRLPFLLLREGRRPLALALLRCHGVAYGRPRPGRETYPGRTNHILPVIVLIPRDKSDGELLTGEQEYLVRAVGQLLPYDEDLQILVASAYADLHDEFRRTLIATVARFQKQLDQPPSRAASALSDIERDLLRQRCIRLRGILTGAEVRSFRNKYGTVITTFLLPSRYYEDVSEDDLSWLRYEISSPNKLDDAGFIDPENKLLDIDDRLLDAALTPATASIDHEAIPTVGLIIPWWRTGCL